MTYYIYNIGLKNCSYSVFAIELLKIHNIPHENIIINYDEKKLYKNNIIDTFPQIYLKRYGKNGSLLLGGYDDLKFTIENFKKQEYDKNKVESFMIKYKWSKKATLRLIELLNSIIDK